MLNISNLIFCGSYFFLLLRSRVYSYIKKKLYLCNENDTRIAHELEKELLLEISNTKKYNYPKIYFMKHRFTLLFALLCASMMTWAAEQNVYLPLAGGCDAYKDKVQWKAIDGVATPANVVEIQLSGGIPSVYVTFPTAEFNEVEGCDWDNHVNGACIWVHLTSITSKYTDIYVKHNGVVKWGFTLYYTDGTDGAGGGEGTDPEPEPSVTGICNATYASNQDGYAVKATVTKGCNRYYLTLTSAVEGKVLTGLSGANMHCTPYGNAASTQALPNYHMVAAGRYTIKDGTITFCIPSVGAPKMYTPLYLQFDNVGTEHTIGGLNNVPLEVCSTESAAICPDPEPTEIWDVNFALLSNGALATSNATSGMPHLAINGNAKDAWDSNHGVDAIDWTVDLGQRRIFNTVNIFWNNAWGKSFDIQVSNNEEDWTTVKEIRDQATSNGSMQVITFDKTTARYVRFHGISRGTGWGYGFYEFQVLLPGVSTLTTIDLKAAATIAKIDGEGLTLTTATKDQNSNPMSGIEITYEVTPADAGSVVDGKYIPAQYGWATIVAKSGEVVSNSIQVFGVNSDNLALSTNIDTDNKVIDQSEITGDANNAFYVVDGNKGNVWQACRDLEGNKSNVEFTSHFTLDLGNTYAINLIAIWFDGAASDDYKIEFSADNITWKEGFRIQQSIGNYLHQKYLTNSELSNNDQARYLRFTTYKASTQNGWGLKIFEFEVYGTEASTTKNISASVSDENRGTAVVKKGDEVVSMVDAGTDVTFIATAKEGYEFVNWTQGSTIVSTEANYTTTITANTALVANFDHIRYAYCHTPVQTSGGYKVYLTVGKGATEGTYQVTIEGSEELTITSIINANTAMNNVKFGAQDGNDVSFTKANNGWTFSDTGYGVITSAEIQPRTGYTWKDMWMWRPDLYIGTNHGEQNINEVLKKYLMWENECADTESPVFSTLNANVINETTIQLVMKATDNWGGLLTYTIARESAEPIIIKGASGEELTQEITGLTKGTKYTFTVSVTDGVNPATSQNIEVTPVGDEEKPVMVSATLESKTWDNAVIAVEATDNKAVVKYHLVDATNSIDAEFVLVDGKISIDGLTANTEYNFTITAKDAAGNESENNKIVTFTTDQHLTAPAEAAPVPTWPADQVKSLYSNTYTSTTTWNYLAGWGQTTQLAAEDIDGNNMLHYSNFNYLGWEIANGAPINALNMEYLHIDIWADQDGQIGIVPIFGGAGLTTDDSKRKIVTLKGQQWNSFDLKLDTEFAGLDFSSIWQVKFDNGTIAAFYIDNAYFYRETPIVDDVVPTNLTVKVNKESFYSIALDVQAEDNMASVSFSIMNGTTEVATGAAASGATTTITVNNLTPNTNYTFTVIAKDEASNKSAPVSVNAKTLAVPAPAPAPTYPADLVKSLYSNAYTPAATFGNTNENWWQAPTNSEVNLGEGNMALLYENIPATSTFGWAFSTFDAIGYQTLHMSIYPLNSGTIEIYPVIQPEGEFHRTSQTLVANQWNDVVIDFSDKTFTTFAQLGFTNYSALGAFFIDNVYFTCPIATTTVDGWGTFASAGKVQVPTGVTAYKAAYSNNGGNEVLVLTELADGIIPAGEGVLIEGAASTTYGFTSTNATPATDMSDNDLIGTTTLTDVSAQRATSDIFCLRRTELFGTTAFCLYSGQYIPAGKAYLALPQLNGQAGAPRNIRMVFNTATGIEDIQGTQVQSTKVIENGQLIIIRDGKRYNAQGARVQ